MTDTDVECGVIGWPYTRDCTFERVRCPGCVKDGRELPPDDDDHSDDYDYEEPSPNRRYRVHMHTAPSPGSTYYEGHVDVWAADEVEAGVRAKREAYRGALHTGLVVDGVELLGR